jgi:hypothetical protein
MKSPIGEQLCIGFRLEVQYADYDYSHVLTREECGPFSITDDTGRVHVDGPFLLANDLEHDWSLVRRERVGFLRDAGVKTRGLLRERQFAFREALLQQGDRVRVRGLVFLEPDPASPAAGLRAPRLIRHIRGADRKPIFVADAD